ncbi:MAG: YeeE/YedE family protein [Betaproteobacteria bacterium]
MTIDWNLFSPQSALAGGLLIGFAAALYILGNGRVAGIAGIVAGALQTLVSSQGRASFKAEIGSWLFLLGLLLAPWAWRLFAPLPMASVDVGPLALVLAGLLVGIGVRMGNGCTSGHGVCGLSRFSLRSLANVLAFMGAGFAVVFVLRHVI